ncbi:MAG: hypothetical protein ABIM99_01850 [Candidatus Dojkabacteria bacterium]
MTPNQILKFLIPVAIIYILGLVIPYALLSNVNFNASFTNLFKVQIYIDTLNTNKPVSSPT